MDDNPYSPPQADLEATPGVPEGPLIPWEDPVSFPGFWDRIRRTLGLLLRPTEAGAALGAGREIAPSIRFMAIVGMPLAWLSQLLVILAGPVNPAQNFLKVFGIPQPPAPDPSAQAAQRVFQIVQLVLFPLLMAIGLGIWGLVTHGGLWLTRGLQQGRGFAVTYRTLMYSAALFYSVGWILNLWVFMPPATGLAFLALSCLAWIGVFTYQGILLAKAHGTDVWRGILGIFAPWLLFCCCCGGLGGLLGFAVAMAARR